MILTKNTILITGGTSGIGLQLATQLSKLGNTVIVTGRDQAKLDKTKKAIPQVHTYQSDVADPKAISALFNQVTKDFPALNILINNAGIMKHMNLHDSDEDLNQLTQEVETNLNGPIRMVKKFLPHLKKQESAAIMNVTSGLAFVPLPTSPVYCAAKAGLHSFTRSLRVQLKKTKVRVFELAPPATETPLLGDFASADMKGITIMKVEDMVKATIKGLETNQFEICPGQSKQLRMMNRIAPEFILSQLSKPVDRMLNEPTV